MSLKDFIKEHKKLVALLGKVAKEGEKQKKEMKKVINTYKKKV